MGVHVRACICACDTEKGKGEERGGERERALAKASTMRGFWYGASLVEFFPFRFSLLPTLHDNVTNLAAHACKPHSTKHVHAWKVLSNLTMALNRL